MMRHKKPPFVHVYNDRHGKARAYYRKPGQRRVPLPLPLYGEAFWIAYRNAEAGTAEQPEPIGAERTKPGSISELIARYYGSASFTGLASSSQGTYRNLLEAFREQHGDKPVSGLKAQHVDAILGEWAKQSKSQAHNLRKRLLMLCSLAVSWGYRDDNPVLSSQKVKHKAKGIRPWTEADIAKFRAHWSTGSAQRIALEVLLNTGLRRSDAVKLGRQHRDGDRHVVSLKKSGGTKTVYIPINADLERELRAATGLVYIQTERGLARSEKAFTNWMRDAASAAGLPTNSSPHGLRKACCRRLAEVGCSSAQISAITGQSIAVIERYIADFNREAAAATAMSSMAAAFTNQTCTKTG